MTGADGDVNHAVRRDEAQRLRSTEGYPIYLHNVGGKEPDGKPTRLGKWTFGTKMVKDVVLDHVDGRVLNACAGKTRLQKRGCEFFRKDIDEDREADLHVDVREIHQHLESETFDAAILDPPFDPGRAEKLYEGWHGQEYSNARDAVGELVCPGGTVVELGWNSWSLSDKDGWEPVEHHIYRQSSFKADVHLTVDRKVNQKRLVPDGGREQLTEVLYYTDGGFEEDADRDDREIPRHRDEDWMRENYVGTDLSYQEIAEMEGVSASTVARHSKRMGFSHRGPDYDLSDVEIPETVPWKNRSLLQTLYEAKDMSTTDIAVEFECSTGTITKWLHKHGIDTRDIASAQKKTWGRGPGIAFQTNTRGREVWNLSGGGHVLVHRLLAVAEHGVDAVADKHVHHINEIKWDNRPENIELVTNAEHGGKHLKVDGIDRIRVAELYENGDISTRDLADELEIDISAGTVREIHKEFYRSDAA